MDSTDLSLKQFKQQVLNDYRLSYLGQELRKQAMVESDCRFVTGQCDVAQVVLARFMEPGDSHVSTGVDLTCSLTKSKYTARSFFQSLFSSAYDAWARGHVSRLSVAVGQALSLASDRVDGEAKKSIVICTLGADFSADGEFFENICFAAARSLPLAVVLWNNTGAYTNGNLIRQLGGFGGMNKQQKTLAIESVKADDYAALWKVMSTQTERSRMGVTTLTFVDGNDNSVETFSKWIQDKQIATQSQILEVEERCRQEVERERRGTYFASLVQDTPLRMPHRQLIDLQQCYTKAHVRLMPIAHIPGVVGKVVGVAQTGLVPVAEIEAGDLTGAAVTALEDYPETNFILRTTDINVGQILAATPANVTVWTPATDQEAAMCYEQAFASAQRVVVVEPGGVKTTRQTDNMTAGGATRLSSGDDVTILTYGVATQTVIDAIGLLEARGISADLFQLTSLKPLDTANAIPESVRKTKRLLIVDPDPAGLAASLILAELSKRPNTMRRLMTSPRTVNPTSFSRPVEPQQVCKIVSDLLIGNN